MIREAELLARDHILAIRKTRGGRRITAVLHPVLGWISPAEYYWLQKSHEVAPYLAGAAAIGALAVAIERAALITSAAIGETVVRLRRELLELNERLSQALDRAEIERLREEILAKEDELKKALPIGPTIGMGRPFEIPFLSDFLRRLLGEPHVTAHL